MDYHLEVLTSEFERRVERNSRYSLRAYASALGLHPSALSRILAGKQDLSPQAALEITSRLKLPTNDQRLFLQALVNARKKKTSEKLGEAIAVPELKPQIRKISAEDHARISRIDSIALMELTLTSGFKNSPEWIAERLNLDAVDVRQVIGLLLELGLLSSEGGQLTKAAMHTECIDTEKSSETRRRNQKEILERAQHAIDTVPFEKRGNFGMTMSIDPGKVAEANRRIIDFHRELCDFLEAGDRTEVYQLATQLFPLSTGIEGAEKAADQTELR